MPDAAETSTVKSPSYIERSSQEWLEKHAKYDNDKKRWLCKKTGAEIQYVGIGRSIHSSDFPGAGSGEVRQIAHVWCPRCGTKPDVQRGTPVNESDLIRIR